MVHKLIRTYISGPIRRCCRAEREKRFEQAELMILNRMEVPVNPMKNGLDTSVNEHMHMAIDLGLIHTCQKIVMLPYWQQSVGAQEELSYAESLGLDVEFLSQEGEQNPYQLASYSPFDTKGDNYM